LLQVSLLFANKNDNGKPCIAPSTWIVTIAKQLLLFLMAQQGNNGRAVSLLHVIHR
jgi:hypothetical protein